MPQIVEIPDVGRVEFPDGMQDADIIKAIQRLRPASQVASPAAENVGAFESGVIAAGRGADKVVQGVRQLYNKATGDQATLAKMAATESENDRLYKPLQDAHPYATAIGEAAPMLAVPAGGAGAGLLSFLARSAAAGAAPGLLSYGDTQDRLKAGTIGAIGGAAGAGLGLGIAKGLKPSGAVSGLSDDAVKAADRVGFHLSAGQRSQNPAMQNFENYLARAPGSSGAMQARNAANQTALNTAGAKAMGQQAADLSEGTFAAAKQGIGAEFGRLEALTKPQLGNDFFQALASVDSANLAKGSFANKEVSSLVDKGLDLAAAGNLTGKAYKEIRTELSNKAQAAFKGGDATVGQAYKTIRNALDESARASLGPADRKAWDVAREQWAAYKALSKSNVAEGGNVSAARAAAAVRQRGDGLRTGAIDGPLADIARVGESVKGVQNPNSGQLTQQMLYGNPLTGLPMMVGNKAAQSIYTNPLVEKYLSMGLLDIGPNGRLVLGKAAGPLGAPLAQQYLGAH